MLGLGKVVTRIVCRIHRYVRARVCGTALKQPDALTVSTNSILRDVLDLDFQVFHSVPTNLGSGFPLIITHIQKQGT